MNIFYLDHNLEKSAQYHIDKHIVKMPLEATQLLTTTVWVDRFIGFTPRKLNSEELSIIREEKSKQPSIEERTFTRYLPTHPNHPCAIWARSSMDNFEWLFNYLISLADEYTFRYNKSHAAMAEAIRLPLPTRLPNIGLTELPQCMPEEYQGSDIVEAYRTYYINDKASIATWKDREQPYWWRYNAP